MPAGVHEGGGSQAGRALAAGRRGRPAVCKRVLRAHRRCDCPWDAVNRVLEPGGALAAGTNLSSVPHSSQIAPAALLTGQPQRARLSVHRHAAAGLTSDARAGGNPHAHEACRACLHLYFSRLGDKNFVGGWRCERASAYKLDLQPHPHRDVRGVRLPNSLVVAPAACCSFVGAACETMHPLAAAEERLAAALCRRHSRLPHRKLFTSLCPSPAALPFLPN